MSLPSTSNDSEVGLLTDVAVTNSMAVGFLATVNQPIDALSMMLNELLVLQKRLLERVELENDCVANNEAVKKVHSTMLRTHRYYKRLLQVRKDLTDVHSKTNKLVIRTQKIQEREEKDAEVRQRIHNIQEENERRLIAKPKSATQSSSKQ